MVAKLCDQKSKQRHTATGRMPCQLQRDENDNQRGRQTVIQVRRNNTHQTGKTGSGPGTCRIYFRMCAILHSEMQIDGKIKPSIERYQSIPIYYPYICKSYRATIEDITYRCILRHKDH